MTILRGMPGFTQVVQVQEPEWTCQLFRSVFYTVSTPSGRLSRLVFMAHQTTVCVHQAGDRRQYQSSSVYSLCFLQARDKHRETALSAAQVRTAADDVVAEALAASHLATRL